MQLACMSCNIAAKRVEKWCYAFNHPHQDFLGLNVDSKARNIAFQLVWQRCCKKKLYVFVARFEEPLSKSATKYLLVTLLWFVLVFNLWFQFYFNINSEKPRGDEPI